MKLHVEIQKSRLSPLVSEVLIKKVDEHLCGIQYLTVNSYILQIPDNLKDHIIEIKSCDLEPIADTKVVEYSSVELLYYIYQLETDGPGIEEMEGDADEGIPAATTWILPSSDFHNLWDSLIYDTNIKEQLLSFVRTSLLFSDRGIDSNVISCNKVVLLHGPPGTGKTSLCRALAQKLSIRLGSRYKFGHLIEVNSHSLFSKWFSESGKLVQKMFTKITEMVEDPDSFVYVLIDEVESLTRTRAATSSGADPSDALRVVNALLTQLDQIRRFPNVLILTTSNITGSVDLAFVDRADIKQYIGLPTPSAIYQIYSSCIVELVKKGIIEPAGCLLTLRQLDITSMVENSATKPSILLWKLSEESVDFSGRTLRKIPFLAHALYTASSRITLEIFLQAMQCAIAKQKVAAKEINA